MVRYAEWTPASRNERRARLLERATAVTILVLAAPASAAMFLLSPGAWSSYFAILCGALAFSWLAVLPTRLFQKRRLVQMRDFPGTVDQVAVKVELYRAAFKYGEDVGLASFVDGWLHFEGNRCSFALPPLSRVSDETLSMPFSGPTRGHRVEFTPIENKSEFKVCFRDWTRGKPSPSEETILPPVIAADHYDEKLIYGVVWTAAAVVMAIFNTMNPRHPWSAELWSGLALTGLFVVARRLDERRRLNQGRPMLGRQHQRVLP